MGTINRSSWQEKLCSGGGSRILDSTTGLTGLIGLSISAQEDTVINACTGYDSAGNAYDFKASRNWVTLKANNTVIVPDDFYFDVLDLTSGNVIINE